MGVNIMTGIVVALRDAMIDLMLREEPAWTIAEWKAYLAELYGDYFEVNYSYVLYIVRNLEGFPLARDVDWKVKWVSECE